jgi:lipopolysaccharide transport system permease protein
LWLWVGREVRVRYKQSLLGVAWAIVQPLFLMLMFTLVFSALVHVPTGGIPYPLFSYAAVLPWVFFASSVNFGTPSLLANMSLVTKAHFPREILPIGAVGASLLDYLVASVLFVVLMAAYAVPLTWTMIWFPFLIVLQIILTLAITLLGASLTVFYHDVRFVVPLALQLWFYATPIIYPLSLVPEKLRPFYMLNPMVTIIDSYRRVLLMGTPPDLIALAGVSALAVVLLIVAYSVFKRLETSFADVI